MPIGVGAGAAIAGLAGAGAAVTGGILSSKATSNAADLQTQAANHAADVQAQSAANTLAFNQQQAQQAFNNAQAAQQGNYNQWAAKEGRLSTLGQQIGMQPFQIPAYVPLQQAPTMVAPTGTQNASATPVDTQNPNVTTMGAAMNPTTPAASPPAPAAGTVTLRNQYGQMKQVPQGQASVWQGLGYQVVG
jgi:hypothetical protein